LNELLGAVELSGKLSHQNQPNPDLYKDAVTRTLFWVCRNIDAYDPQKGKFMAWINYRLDMILREIQQELKDPFIRSVEGKIFRTKYQLNGFLKKVKPEDFKLWLMLNLKGLIPNYPLGLTIIFLSVVLLLLSQLMIQNPLLGNTLLLEMSRASFSMLPTLYDVPEDAKGLEEIAQPDDQPYLSDMLKIYIEEDPEGLLQKHVKDHPRATFQAIAIARLEGKTWQELSRSFDISIPTLNNFFLRRLKELAPEIRRHVQEHTD
jgi:hypothetical protein